MPKNATSLHDIFLSPFPSSIVDSLARGDILQIVVFALVFGFACSSIGAPAEPVVRFCESLSDVMFRYTDYVMLAAPIGIFGAMSAAIGTKGLTVLLSLGKLVFTVYGALILFTIVVLGPVLWFSRVPLVGSFQWCASPSRSHLQRHRATLGCRWRSRRCRNLAYRSTLHRSSSHSA